MRHTNGGMRLIVRPQADHRATTISAHCQEYLISPSPTDSWAIRMGGTEPGPTPNISILSWLKLGAAS
jgi:hypothetical protein